MPLKSYLIGPFESGIINAVQPWLLPEDAFQFLEDAYVWRGRVRKRFGYSLIGETPLESRLRINIGTTDGSGNISTAVPGNVYAIGQGFSIGTEIFTVVVLGTPGNMITTGAATTATYDTSNGNVVINGAAASTDVYFYPALPVMGLRTRETTSVNLEEVIAFDTRFAYHRSGLAWERLGTDVWSGEDNDFFWSVNYRGSNPYETFFYVVNGVAADNIKYIQQGAVAWTNLRPQLNNGGN